MRQRSTDTFEINPTLEVVPREGEEWTLLWNDPTTDERRVESSTEADLLVLKMLAEELAPEDVAASGNIAVEIVEEALNRAVRKGIVLAPQSRIRRDTSLFADGDATPAAFVTANSFVLQWHITHACDLRCKHCYDRSERSPLTLAQGTAVLDDLKAFCRDRHVKGHVCFSGGNPFLYPNFFELYAAAVQRRFSTSILANPVPREQVERIVEIQRPGYFQVSLEGLPEHNDEVRGEGFYYRVIEFLGVLRDLNISSTVMLTLTKDNIDQIIPLAEKLRGHADHFTFNRLSPVGSGAELTLPSREEYASFLKDYVNASMDNPIMGYKDNLINAELDRRGMELFDGCTGFGCGAAFNFIAVLPDGEAHACRKFPSPIGNVLEQGIAKIYDSEEARTYRRGSTACNGCKLRHGCGGCLSVVHGCGGDISRDKDPYCCI